MKTYLKDILPRLKKYSQSLDQTAMLTDKPWVVNAGNNQYQKLIFRKDGSLLLSRNGDLTDGKWEYIPGANSIVIDYGSSKVLYRHSFMDEAVLALQKDGPVHSDDEIFLLANENVIADSNAIGYLSNKYVAVENAVQAKSKINLGVHGYLWVTNGEQPKVGDTAYGVYSGVFKVVIEYDTYKIHVENGTVTKVKYCFWSLP